jgi:phosphatidylserine/phosphatidylglycerophosphate/cardiolipin synthase-like enzyme
VSLPGLGALDQYSASGFPPGYNPLSRTFYSPVDQVHMALRDVAASASVSLIVAVYGFDDDELAQIIHDKIAVPGLFVQLSLDSSQAAGVHERAILAKQDYPETSIAIGRSERGAIMHMKALIVDGLYLCDGSTNWSTSGESLQDNQLTIIQDPLACAKARARVDSVHDSMLMQMAAAAAKGK